MNIRVAIPGGSVFLIYAYYGLCFIAGFIALGSDLLAALIALLECSINILLQLLSILLLLYSIGDQISEGKDIIYTFGNTELVHFAIAGTFLVLSFYQNPLIRRAR